MICALCRGLTLYTTACRDPITVNPDDIVMPIRMCVMLWGIAYHLRYQQRVYEQLLPTAHRLLREQDPSYLDRWK